MKPLVMLLKRLGAPMVRSRAARHASDRRAAPRHDVDYAVSFRRRGLAPVAGTVINISRGGAAVRVHGWHIPVPSPWPIRLKHGDEVWLADLLEEPIACWVVGIEEGVLRVHFTQNEATRRKLREKYPILAR
jgi:hypothetical protein